MAHVLVTGGSGFIGRALCPKLHSVGHQVTVLTRNSAAAARDLSPDATLVNKLDQLSQLEAVDTVINLAGEPLADRRWSARRKEQFHASRVGLTSQLFSYFDNVAEKPRLLISGSAIGYYGPHWDEVLDEQGAAADCFSHQLCAAWEEEARRFESFNTRVCLLRTGVVLGPGGGALAALLPPFRLGLGGPIASGQQWMSWIHRDDLVALICHAMDCASLCGALNGTAPGAVTNRKFAQALGAVLRRPSFMPTPAWAMRLLFGEMADELLISGQRVYPAKALDSGFQFTYPQLVPALHQILAV